VRAGGAVVVVLVGVRVFFGTGSEARAEVFDGVGDFDGVRDGDLEVLIVLVGVGVALGIDGRATRGAFDASAGPTARTATQTTNSTRIAVPKLRRNLAVPNTYAECLAATFDLSPRIRAGKDQAPAGKTTCQDMPLARLPRERLISFCASRWARSCRLS